MSNKEGEAMGGERVKVRVAVSVNGDGHWFVPWQNAKHSADADDLRNDQHPEAAVYVLTAELPIPTPPAPQEVAAGVEVDG